LASTAISSKTDLRDVSIIGSSFHFTKETIMKKYIHGYSETETHRLGDQASILASHLHHDSHFPAGSTVLEVGCGVGAQTKILAAANPDVHFTSIDIDYQSLQKAAQEIERLGLTNVCFQQADIFNLPFLSNDFDYVFCCFVLEHLPDPCTALLSLKKVLKPAGTLTVIEGDHGSFLSFPESEESRKTVHCLVELQAQAGGNSLIGRELSALLRRTGFANIRVSPRQIYADAGRPEVVEGFSRRTFIAMVEGVGERAIRDGLITNAAWEKGIADLYEATGPYGSFTYTFFKANAEKV
jgi:ubiquinone/menaquinone biosynthesis C-methylase UbiE